MTPSASAQGISDPPEEARGLRPRHLEPSLQPRHHDRLVVVGDAVVRVEPLHVVIAEEAEGAHAEEAEPRDAEVGRELRRPWVAEVRHHARRVRRVRAEVGLNRLAKKRHGFEVVPHVLPRDVVHVVHPFGHAGRRVVERERDEPDRQPRSHAGRDGRAHPRSHGWSADDGADRAVGREQQCGVDGRDQVALRHQRDEHEVRRLRAAGGIEASTAVACCCFLFAAHPCGRRCRTPRIGAVRTWGTGVYVYESDRITASR
ncbi:hypothetical protein EJB05_45738, partial [Eragrostis curvula]